MKRISNPRFISMILISIVSIFLLIHQEIFACSEEVDYTLVHIETFPSGDCELDVGKFGMLKVKGQETTIQYGDLIMYMANKDEEACPDDFDVILEVTICMPGG